MENQLQGAVIQLLTILIGGGLSIVTAYVGLFVAKATQKAKVEISKMEDEQMQVVLNNALKRTDELIRVNIIAAEQTLKVELVQAIADGKIDKSELKQLSVAVKDNVLNQLADGTVDVLNNGIGDLSQYIEVKIEEQLADIKGQIK